MEEGPEPQEWVERTVEHQHHEHEHGPVEDAARRQTTVSAITAAVLAVFAAFGSLLSGHEANQAIVHQSQASDQWAYFQAKSTKGHVYEAVREGVRAIAEAQGSNQAEKIKPILSDFDRKVQKYEQDKEPIQQKAEHLEKESRYELEKHHFFALGIASFQVGVVLASISIMLRHRLVWYASLFAGLVGIMFLLRGFVLAA